MVQAIQTPSLLASPIQVACGSPTIACSECVVNILTVLVAYANLSVFDFGTLGRCISNTTVYLLSQGATLVALDSLRDCPSTPFPVPPDTVCEVTLNESTALAAFSAAASNQCSERLVNTFVTQQYSCGANTTCLSETLLCRPGGCTDMLITPFIAAGLAPEYNKLGACLYAYAPLIMRSRIPYQVLTRVSSCPARGGSGAATSTRPFPVTTVAVAVALGGAALLLMFAAMVTTTRLRRQRLLLEMSMSQHGSEHPIEMTGRGSIGSVYGSDAERGLGPTLIAKQDVVLGDQLGVGGFSTVYLARWRGTSVAAKVFVPSQAGLAASMVTGEFQPIGALLGSGSQAAAVLLPQHEHELRVLTALRHPNVCAVYGFVLEPPMLIIEFCEGGSLAQLLKHSRLAELPWGMRVAIGAGVACGLEFLHAQRVVHCDLKSANVVLTANRTPKLCDFGLSTLREGLDGGAQSGAARSLRGTPRFMAPEVMQGAEPQAPADVYGLGCVLHDLAHVGVGGEAEASTAGGLQADTSSSAALNLPDLIAHRLRAGFAVSLGAHVPTRLAALLRACLAEAPEARPSASDVLEELQLLEGEAAQWL